MTAISEFRDPACPICREEWRLQTPQNEVPSELKPTALKCGHVFHAGCIAGWFNRSIERTLKCPICRAVDRINPNAHITSMQHALPWGPIINDICALVVQVAIVAFAMCICNYEAKN